MQLITKEELAELIFENKEGMYRLAYTIVENDADAQDAVGMSIVKTFGNIQRLRKKQVQNHADADIGKFST